jgi:hypothetical protein
MPPRGAAHFRTDKRPQEPTGIACGRPSAAFWVLLVGFFGVSLSFSQEHAHFQLYLDLNTASAERAIEIYQGLSGRPADAARERGSQLSLAVTGTLAGRRLDTPALEQALEAAKFNQNMGDDVFQMRGARENIAALKDLFLELRRRNFAQRVVSTVEQLFPVDAQIQARIPMYVVRVRWEENIPLPADENDGELTIVVNLAKAVRYGNETDERFIGLLSVVAHEVFHAAYGVYKQSTPEWRSYYSVQRTPLEELLDLSQNEGVAYYLSLIQRTHGRLPADGLQRAQAAFTRFNAVASELLLPSTSRSRVSELLRESNTSGYWESFGSITGMMIARQIDQTLGRSALVETLRGPPQVFFRTYVDLMRRDSGVPALSPQVINQIR